ncbi:MAG: S-layer homology domain-containing protein [Peptococcaceae bacterium]|nr:S-layer homology domain-containing protein [Peptococcaceae bacterium]
MGKIKKIFIVLAAVSLTVTLSAGSALANPRWKEHPWGKGQYKANAFKKVLFTDISGHWAEQSIVFMNACNVIKGYGDNTFQPNKPVNKEEAITMIVRMLNGDVSYQPLPGKYRTGNRASQWAMSYLEMAVEKGILSEVEINTLAFNKPAQRYEVAVWLVRALGLEDEAIENADAGLGFKDEPAIPAWARGYVKVATDENIIRGYPGQVFRPGAPITRAEMVTMLARAREGSEIPSPNQGFSFIRGTIIKVDEDDYSITVRKAAGPRTGELTVDVADDAFIYLDGKTAGLEDLKNGYAVSVLVNSGNEAIVIMARSIGDGAADEDETDNVEGVVESISSSSITVKVDGKLKVYALDKNVEVEVNGEEADLDDVEKGYDVEMTLEGGKVVKIEAESGEYEVSGIVESVGDDTITVKVNGVLKVYELSEDVDVTLDGDDAGLEDLEKGYEVELTVEKGEVTEIDAESETITCVLESVGSSSITVKVNGVLKAYSLSSGVDVIIDGDEGDLDDLDKGMDLELTMENGKVIKIEAES